MFTEKIFFKKKQYPNKLEDYFVLSNQKNLKEIIKEKWTKDFLKNFISNKILLKFAKGYLKRIDSVKIKPSDLSNQFEFCDKFEGENKFNRHTSQTCVQLLGLNNDQTRRILYDIKEENNLVLIKLKDDLVYTKFSDFSMKDLLPADLKPPTLEAIDKCIIENYSLNEFFTLQELMYDLEELGFKESDILNWKLNIEKNQMSNNTFESILLKIETKSGVMGALGLRNKTQHAKLKFLNIED